MAIHGPALSRETDLAELARPTFRFFTDQAGLPQNTINCITVDRKGYLWVGTQDGAAYYNGRQWTVVNMPNRTASNDVTNILAASDGSLWFTTNGGGLANLKDGNWIRFDTTNSGLPDDSLEGLVEIIEPDGHSTLWIGTSQGLVRYEQNHWTVFSTQNSGLSDNLISSILAVTDSSGKQSLWIGSSTGFTCYESGQWKHFENHQEGRGPAQVLQMCTTRSFTGNTVLWVGTNGNGLIRHEAGQSVFLTPDNSELPDGVIQALCPTISPSGKEALWVGTAGGLVWLEETSQLQGTGDRVQGLESQALPKYRWKITTTENSNLSSNLISSLFELTNSSGWRTLWVGTYSNGLGRFEEQGWVSLSARNFPSIGSRAYSLLETISPAGQFTFWIGTNSNGLFRYEAGQWTTINTQTSNLPSNQILSLLETRSPSHPSTLWVGTDGSGLACLETSRWTTLTAENSGLPGNIVNCLCRAASASDPSALWIGTLNGLARFEAGQWTTLTEENSDLPSNRVFCLHESLSSDGQPCLWVGTLGGGLASLKNGKWTIWNSASSQLPNNSVLSLLETTAPSGKRVLWVGTYGGGVACFEIDSPAAPWLVLTDTTTPELPNNTIYQICEDAQKRIYLLTNKGVVRLTPRLPTPDNPASYAVYTFSIENGLPGSEGNQGASLVDHQGRIWVGTTGGVAMLDPARAVDDRSPKPLYIERLIINRTERRGSDQPFSLPYTENSLAFDFALLSYFRETDTMYQVQLAGYDSQPTPWTSASTKEYTNLKAGDYIFNVWGRDSFGTIAGPVSVRFTIRPAPWNTWWAYLVYLLGLAGAGYGGVQWQLRTLRRRNELLEHNVKLRTEELSQQKAELGQKVQELYQKNQELVESHQRADRIFSALAEALPGTVLDGKYRLDEKIGAGGFGVVFRGTHLTLHHPIAIKVFKPSSGNDSPKAVERFKLEGVTAARLNHPNIVRVLDSGISTDGIAYLVLELLHGHSLARELREVKILSLERSAMILISVCDALAEAHRQGLVHRDIKPDNIFLHQTPDGEVVKVVDFGIAKMLEASSDVNLQNLTVTDGLIGTPKYMSPERLEGESYDGRSDVYSLGLVLYEMLCGEVPFYSPTNGLLGMIKRRITELPKPPGAINPALSEAVETVMLQALARIPDQRPTAEELKQQFLSASGLDLTTLKASSVYSLPVQTLTENELSRDSLSSLIHSRALAHRMTHVGNILADLLERSPGNRETVVQEISTDDPQLKATITALVAPGDQELQGEFLTKELWIKIEKVFFSVLNYPPHQWAEVLDEECAGNAFLRQKVELLIAADLEARE
ncbi:MAG: protein kinase [Acidobacteria bacterium]|nr:protein kinase [Acidobacteriota bacterium]